MTITRQTVIGDIDVYKRQAQQVQNAEAHRLAGQGQQRHRRCV